MGVETPTCPWCKNKETKSYCFKSEQFSRSDNRSRHMKRCPKKPDKNETEEVQREKLLRALVQAFSLGSILGKVVKQGVVVETSEGERRYLEWTDNSGGIDLLWVSKEPLLEPGWATSSIRKRKRKKVENDDLDGDFWNTSTRREPLKREVLFPQKEQLHEDGEILSLQAKVSDFFLS